MLTRMCALTYPPMRAQDNPQTWKGARAQSRRAGTWQGCLEGDDSRTMFCIAQGIMARLAARDPTGALAPGCLMLIKPAQHHAYNTHEFTACKHSLLSCPMRSVPGGRCMLTEERLPSRRRYDPGLCAETNSTFQRMGAHPPCEAEGRGSSLGGRSWCRCCSSGNRLSDERNGADENPASPPAPIAGSGPGPWIRVGMPGAYTASPISGRNSRGTSSLSP